MTVTRISYRNTLGSEHFEKPQFEKKLLKTKIYNYNGVMYRESLKDNFFHFQFV